MDRKEILKKLAGGELTEDEADKLLDKLEREKRSSLYCKVGKSGAISVYGLQRFPVTLYVEQWERLLDFAEGIRQFAKSRNHFARGSPRAARQFQIGPCLQIVG